MSDAAFEEIVLAFPGEPVPWAPKHTNPKDGRKFVPARQAKYAGKVIDAWERSMFSDRYFEKGQPLRITAEFYIARPRTTHYGSGANEKTLKPNAPILPTGKPDGSNLVKAIEDALTGVAWADDDQFVDNSGSKRFVDWWKPPSTLARITILPYRTVEEYRIHQAGQEQASLTT